jgi:hypothetical protein
MAISADLPKEELSSFSILEVKQWPGFTSSVTMGAAK